MDTFSYFPTINIKLLGDLKKACKALKLLRGTRLIPLSYFSYNYIYMYMVPVFNIHLQKLVQIIIIPTNMPEGVWTSN